MEEWRKLPVDSVLLSLYNELTKFGHANRGLGNKAAAARKVDVNEFIPQ